MGRGTPTNCSIFILMLPVIDNPRVFQTAHLPKNICQIIKPTIKLQIDQANSKNFIIPEETVNFPPQIMFISSWLFTLIKSARKNCLQDIFFQVSDELRNVFTKHQNVMILVVSMNGKSLLSYWMEIRGSFESILNSIKIFCDEKLQGGMGKLY